MAKIAIALLLFAVGLKLDSRLIRTLGPLAIVPGVGQMMFSSIVGYCAADGRSLESFMRLRSAVDPV